MAQEPHGLQKRDEMKERGQRMAALSSMTLRSLISRANELGIRHEDVVSVVRESEAFILLYYKNEGKKDE